MTEIAPTVTLSQIEKQVQLYLDCWKEHGSKFINIPESVRRKILIERAVTPCERYLLIKGFQMHALEYSAFMKIPILLLNTQQYQINHDHFFYWAFAADVYDFFKDEMREVYDSEIESRFRLLMGFVLLGSHNPNLTQEGQRIRRAGESLIRHLSNVQSNTHIIAAHLAYPLLEGVARRISSSFVETDGKLKVDILTFQSADGETVKHHRAGSTLNRINDVLRLLETRIANQDLRNDLAEYRFNFEKVHSQSGERAYDIIDEFRNKLLHGEEVWQLFYAALINLICVLLSSRISKGSYESKYADLVRRIESNWRMGDISPFGFYPPV